MIQGTSGNFVRAHGDGHVDTSTSASNFVKIHFSPKKYTVMCFKFY